MYLLLLTLWLAGGGPAKALVRVVVAVPLAIFRCGTEANTFVTVLVALSAKGCQTGVYNALDAYSRCAEDNASVHQCEICLMVGHGSAGKKKCPKQKAAGKGGKRK